MRVTVWEYDVKEIRFSEWSKTKEDLNSLGVEGWELIKFAEEIFALLKVAGGFH